MDRTGAFAYDHLMEHSEPSARPLWLRVLAVAVLALAAWVLLKLVVGVLTTIAWVVAVVVAVIGIAWAMQVLRR